MPLYDYRCHKCGETYEVRQRISEEPLTTHEGCGGMVERLISVPALQFKGTGWYVTDYARSGKPASDEKGGDKAAKSDGKPDSSKTDTKSANKTENKPAPAKPSE
jgi:putative FmdB family regulatory protein